MQTHYVRRPNGEGRLTNPVETLVYAVIGTDALVPVEQVYELTAARAAKEDERQPTRKAVEAALRSLVIEKLIHEVHGTRLTRLLAT